MQIYINTLFSREIIALKVQPRDTIRDVKNKIQTRHGIPVEEQTLVFAGSRHGNATKLKDCNVNDQSMMHLVLTFCKWIKIFVRTLPGEIFEFVVMDTDCVDDLKLKIEDQEGILGVHQILRFGGVELEGRLRLKDCWIEDGSYLNMFLREPDVITNLDD